MLVYCSSHEAPSVAQEINLFVFCSLHEMFLSFGNTELIVFFVSETELQGCRWVHPKINKGVHFFLWKEGRVGRRGGMGEVIHNLSFLFFFFKEESTWKLSYSLLLILNSNIKITFWKEFLLISSSLIKWKKRVITTTELLYESPFLKKNLACLWFFLFLNI